MCAQLSRFLPSKSVIRLAFHSRTLIRSRLTWPVSVASTRYWTAFTPFFSGSFSVAVAQSSQVTVVGSVTWRILRPLTYTLTVLGPLNGSGPLE